MTGQVKKCCPSCGHKDTDWVTWANNQSTPYRIEIERGDGQSFQCSENLAKVAVILQNAGPSGLTKREIPGWHLGHWVMMLRLEGLSISTEMVRKTWPKKSVHAVYRLEEPVTITRLPKKAKPTRGNERVSNPKAFRQESEVDREKV